MYIILLSHNPALQANLAHKVLPDGLNILRLNELDEVMASVPDRGRICIIDDGQLEPEEVEKFIINVKKDPTKQTARLFVITKSRDSNFIKKLVVQGADSVFQSSLHFDTLVEKVMSFIEQTAEQHQQRKFIRIKTGEKEETNIKILSNQTKSYIEGKITDISMGGIAVNFNPDELAQLPVNEVFHNCQLKLEGKKNITVDIVLVKKGGPLGAFAFQKVRAAFRDVLAEYIFEKVQKNMN